MSNRTIMAGLNSAQAQAVKHTEGALLIFAGAGSGKTKTIVHRLAYILDAGLAKPSGILALTFTNKASGEMKQRIAGLLRSPSVDSSNDWLPFMGTFHGICHRILRLEPETAGLPANFIIYDRSDCRQVVKRAAAGITTALHKPYSDKYLLEAISRSKCGRAVSHELAGQTYFQDIFRRYQAELRRLGALDFDDLIVMTVKLLRGNSLVRHRWQARFKYVTVDEYQDTDALQYDLIRLLAAPANNIAVVGDDWQSIYGWRGADYGIMLNFRKDYPDAKVVYLERNYRSSQNILDAAAAVISKNESRSNKKLWTDSGPGDKVGTWQTLNEFDEARRVIREIKRQVTAGKRRQKDFAIFYRINAQSRALEEALIDECLDYRIYGGIRFYDRSEIKDLVAYLRLAHQHNDRVSFDRAVNTPPRGLGAASLATFDKWLNDQNLSLEAGLKRVGGLKHLRTTAVAAFKRFAGLITDSQNVNLPPSKLLTKIIEDTNYIDYLRDGTPAGRSKEENVAEFRALASKYDGVGLVKFLEDIALYASSDYASGKLDSVSLMTLHSSKGLEFPVVFMVGVEEGLLPHVFALKAGTHELLAEERRLCYVGMTRAMEKLYLTWAEMRDTYALERDPFETAASRFLDDIPEELTEVC